MSYLKIQLAQEDMILCKKNQLIYFNFITDYIYNICMTYTCIYHNLLNLRNSNYYSFFTILFSH